MIKHVDVYFEQSKMDCGLMYELCPACRAFLSPPNHYLFETGELISISECLCGAMWATRIASLDKEI